MVVYGMMSIQSQLDQFYLIKTNAKTIQHLPHTLAIFHFADKIT